MKTICYLISILLSSAASAQTLSSVTQAGGVFDDAINGMTTDASGNLYTAGYITGSAPYFGITFSGRADAPNTFLAKHDAAGNLVWSQLLGHPSDTEARAVKIDGAGNIFVMGIFRETVQFGSHLVQESPPGSGTYLLKLDPGGQVLWAKSLGAITGQALALDASGNAFVCANFTGTRTVGSFTITGTLSEAAIVRVSSQGAINWVRTGGSAGTDYATAVATDAAGNCLLAGRFAYIAQFGSQTLSSAGQGDLFLAKYDATGNLLWVKRGGGVNNDQATCLAVDQQGHVLVGGFFGSQFSYMGLSLSASGQSGVLLETDADGNPVTAHAFGSSGTTDVCTPRALILDAAGDVYLTGSFLTPSTVSPLADFGGISLRGGSLFDNCFVAKFNRAGQAQWALALNGTQYVHGKALALAPSGALFVGGTFNTSILTYNMVNQFLNTSNYNRYNIFLAVVGQTVSAPEPLSGADLQVFPNPSAGTFRLSGLPANAVKLVIRDAVGRTVHQERLGSSAEAASLRLAQQPEGVYLLEVHTPEAKIMRKLVLQR